MYIIYTKIPIEYLAWFSFYVLFQHTKCFLSTSCVTCNENIMKNKRHRLISRSSFCHGQKDRETCKVIYRQKILLLFMINSMEKIRVMR